MSRRNSRRVDELAGQHALQSQRKFAQFLRRSGCVPPLSLKYSPRVAKAHLALGAYLMYPAMPLQCEAETGARGKVIVAVVIVRHEGKLALGE